MADLRVAVIFDDAARPDTTGFYCLRAMSCLARVAHVRPQELGRVDRDDFDLFVNIDDGLQYRLPTTLHPCVWWAIDTHLDLNWYGHKAPDFDVVFSAQRDGAADLSKLTERPVRWLPLGCDPAFHRKHDLAKKWNLSFIGHVFPGPRADLVKLLQQEFTDVLVDQRFFDDMARAFSESRLVFNRSISNDVNMRVFEAAAAGSLLLTNDLTDNGLRELFEYGEHLETYASAEELLDKTRFYLTHDASRDRIGELGRAHAYRHHTYRRRMQTLLEVATQELSLKRAAVPGAETSFRHSEPPIAVTSIVIPTHNQIEFTRQCLDSLRTNTDGPFELIVVDNGSTDGTVEYLEDCPDVMLVCNRENRGFPTAVNQGIRLARGKWVLLLNNDTVVPSGWLSRLLRPLRYDDSIGLVGPCSNRVSGEQQIEVVYEDVDQLDAFAAELAERNDGAIEDTDRLVGFCLLIVRRLIDHIGLLDEGFGLGCFEDDDYALRARQAGFRVVIARDAFVHHYGSQTFRGSGIDLADLLRRNQDRFVTKWSHPPEPTITTRSSRDDSLLGGARHSLRVLLLAHVGFLRGRLDRSQYLRYLALSKHENVSLFGPGVEGYRPGMSVDEAIGIACGGTRPDWILHGLDPKASGDPIVRGLSTCGIPAAYEFGDSWTQCDQQSRFINEQRFRVAFVLATRDIPFYRSVCPDTEFVFLPNAVDTGIYQDYGEAKDYDVLLYGAVNPEFYPLRSRIANALAQQTALRVHHIPHPDYYPTGGWDNAQVIAGENLSREIGRAWICIATKSVFGVLLTKYLEIAASNTAIAGDMPQDGRPFFSDDYIDLAHCRDDAEIISRLQYALKDKEQLSKMARRVHRRVMDELSTEIFATRVLQLLSDSSTANSARSRSSCARQTPDVPRSAVSEETPIVELRQRFSWPQCPPKVRPQKTIEGWMADGAQEALQATLGSHIRIVLELGSWLGLSTRFIADCAPGAQVIALDHFEGNPEHRTDPQTKDQLPTLYEDFLARCWSYRSRIIPVRATTVTGMQMLAAAGVKPDVIYVDADHNYAAVQADLSTAWTLFPSAILVGDDYPADTVQLAVRELAQANGIAVEVFGKAWTAWRLKPKNRSVHSSNSVRSLSSGAVPRISEQSATVCATEIDAGADAINPAVKISLCMIVRDNRHTLDACLGSIKPWVDEMIVVDTGSQDDTPEIAQRHGAKVFHFPWPDSFAVARNESLRHATGEWLFWMDSDDTISADNGQKLKDLMSGQIPPNVMGFIMQVHCPNAGPDGDPDVTVVDHVKMFRNCPDLRFDGRIHEQIMPAIRRAGGELVWTDLFVLHSGSDHSPEGRRQKQQRDLRLLEMEAIEKPGHSFVLFNIGMTYADMEDHASAVPVLTQSIAASEPSESHLRKAYALLVASQIQLNQIEQANQVCRDGLELFPSDVELRFRQGFIAQIRGQFEDAVTAYRQALTTPEDRHFGSLDRGLQGHKTRHNLALVYEAMGRLSEGEEQWRLIVGEVPGYRPGWHGLANNLLAQGRPERLAKEIQRMTDQNGRSVDVHLLRSQLAKAQGDVPAALREIENGLLQYTNDRRLLERLCQLLFEQGMSVEAESRLRELVALDPNDASAWHNLGTTYLRLQQFRAAEDALRQAIRLRENSAVSYLYLGFVHDQLGDAVAASEAWEQATRVAPHDPAAEEARVRLRERSAFAPVPSDNRSMMSSKTRKPTIQLPAIH